MPIRCSNGDTTELAYQHDVESWEELRRRSRNLSFDCCGAGVVLKTSKLGTRYFAHKARGECSSAPETAEHLKAKSVICQSLDRAGWSSTPECRFNDPEGLCIADVLGRRNPTSTTGVAFEVQRSPQTLEETIRRTERYHQHGLRTLWLMKQFDIPTSKDVPAARIADEDGEFGVYLPKPRLIQDRRWISRQELRDPINWVRCGSLEQFVIGVSSGKFKFGFSSDIEASVTVEVIIEPCWRCNRKHGAFWGLSINLPNTCRPVHPSYYLTLQDIGNAKDCYLKNAIIDEVNHHLPQHHGKPLSMRYSKTVSARYLANSCGHCGALIGNFYLGQGRTDDDVDIQWTFPMRARLADFQQLVKIVEHWSFLEPDPLGTTDDIELVRHQRMKTISISEAVAITSGLKWV